MEERYIQTGEYIKDSLSFCSLGLQYLTPYAVLAETSKLLTKACNDAPKRIHVNCNNVGQFSIGNNLLSLDCLKSVYLKGIYRLESLMVEFLEKDLPEVNIDDFVHDDMGNLNTGVSLITGISKYEIMKYFIPRSGFEEAAGSVNNHINVKKMYDLCTYLGEILFFLILLSSGQPSRALQLGSVFLLRTRVFKICK